jgi:ABC-type transport system involved in multi-copper enzyme maturation permease subunit
MDPAEMARFDPVGRSLAGVNLAQLAIGVLGVLLISGEYGTGMVRSTFAAVPKRLPVLWAKAALFALITFVIMVPSAFVAFLGGQQLLGSHGTTLSAHGALRAVFGVALYLTVIAVFAVALGFLVRSTAGGIATLFGILLVLPGIGSALPASWQTSVLPYLPSRAGGALYDLHPDPGTLAPWTGFGVLCAWAAAALIAAAVVLKRRDV